MISLLRKEINQFFSSLTGYLAILVFLVVTALFLFVFPGSLNVFDFGFADLSPFFELAPLVLLFLIPAITMRTFAEERSTGTLEWLVTKPLTDWSIVGAKYLAALVLLLFSLLPTLIFVYTIYQLADPVGAIDTGSIIGSYIGLLLLGAVFIAIGLLASALSANQIVAFILGVFLCFFVFYAFDFIGDMEVFQGNADYYIKQIGINAHYQSISRGVLDTRDLVYFLSVAGLFLAATKTALERRKW